MDNIKPVHCGCGGEAKVEWSSGYDPFAEKRKPNLWYGVICKKCKIQTKAYYTEAEAIEAWNRAMSAKDINVPNKDTVIIEPFTTDMNHVGYCKCGYLVNAEWEYCPHCGARLEWR